MPRISYECTKCHRVTKRSFQKASFIKDTVECKYCGARSERLLGSPSTKSTMVVDNGLQGRKTEIIHDIVSLNKERDEKGYNRGD